MSGWEYKVVPAPTKGVKARGIKGADGRFAHALETLMNEMASDGWEFQRAETLPSVERSGLTGSTTEWRNVMVFRRASAGQSDAFEHELLPPPEPAARIKPRFVAPAKAVDSAADDQNSDSDASPSEDASSSSADAAQPESEQNAEISDQSASDAGDSEQTHAEKSKE